MTTTTVKGTELDAWCAQIQTFADMQTFVRRHGPNSASPLPLLHWSISAFHTAGADLPACDDPVTVLKAFAAVLGGDVTARHLDDRIIYATTGRIGAKQGPKQISRTQIIVRAVVFREQDGDDL